MLQIVKLFITKFPQSVQKERIGEGKILRSRLTSYPLNSVEACLLSPKLIVESRFFNNSSFNVKRKGYNTLTNQRDSSILEQWVNEISKNLSVFLTKSEA